MGVILIEILRAILPIMPLMVFIDGSSLGVFDAEDCLTISLFICATIICMWISVAYDRKSK